ncbi:hypothetical protein JCM21738_5555 [Mesobacillus boroniphilus JCM 21738]|uniref:Uncharacterized protein n=1 Tax=Mesobacillus boroniphilus JCM 21738 TaxID=1294265 RepID=W4RXS2_9BACI|nr:hypothetical protein JCM21738_5555 [Mesobacillus boroniphilus JCM 21738]
MPESLVIGNHLFGLEKATQFQSGLLYILQFTIDILQVDGPCLFGLTFFNDKLLLSFEILTFQLQLIADDPQTGVDTHQNKI